MFVWIVLVRKEKKLELKYNNNKKIKKLYLNSFPKTHFISKNAIQMIVV
jgi:NADPH-dependent 7-cyano-7-deazaguanine reductase QueF-like protein